MICINNKLCVRCAHTHIEYVCVYSVYAKGVGLKRPVICICYI